MTDSPYMGVPECVAWILARDKKYCRKVAGHHRREGYVAALEMLEAHFGTDEVQAALREIDTAVQAGKLKPSLGWRKDV